MSDAKYSVYRKSRATTANATPDTIGSRMKQYKTGGECDKCGQRLIQRLKRHRERCESLPSAEEIADILEDPLRSIDAIAREYGTRTAWITSIVLSGDNSWTLKKLTEHGYKARTLIQKEQRESRSNGTTRKHHTIEGPRCICGILVPEEGDECKFCIMESKGIRSYHDMSSFSR